VVVVLAGAFFRHQILRTSRYVLQSEQNRLRAISVPAPRGTIYDRAGRVVAENVPGYTVSLLPGREDTVRAALDRLAPYLGLDQERTSALMQKYRRFPKRPLVVDEDASFREVSAIEERRPQFRRAVVEMRPRRRYPAGDVTAHVTGYVGEISGGQLADTTFAGYDPGRVVGKTGLERAYEDRLGGDPGVRYMEVTALGSVVREFGPQEGVEPTPGEDLRLALDLSLQAFADSVFPDHREGAVLAMDPRTGGVLTLYSHPGFDPNAFVGGVDQEVWERLRDDPDEPILNRVTGAAYSPGSTWKLVVATESMRRGLVSIGDRMEIPCRGALRYGGRLFRCWRPEGHGSLDLADAIQQSCNVFFYQLGLRLGLDAMLDGAQRLGYNRPTGIDLPHELSGHVPESAEWFDRRYGPRGWSTGVVLNLAIGQGENDQTLLRQAIFYSALATGRPPLVPHLARREVAEPSRMDWSLDLPEARRRELVDAMTRVVNEPDGTAYAWRLRRWTLAGKTGTAQNPQGEPHSWFIGFVPVEDPELVVAAFVEHGHPDNTTSLAVPIASRVARRYMEVRHPEEAGGPPTPAREVATPDAPPPPRIRPPADRSGTGEGAQ
jgi:penicillin-binding protein 2